MSFCSFFLLAIVLFVLQLKASDHPFGNLVSSNFSYWQGKSPNRYNKLTGIGLVIGNTTIRPPRPYPKQVIILSSYHQLVLAMIYAYTKIHTTYMKVQISFNVHISLKVQISFKVHVQISLKGYLLKHNFTFSKTKT